jgi:hypothetical protein
MGPNVPSNEMATPRRKCRLAGQRVGIKEVDEGIWIVSLMLYDLGYIDLKQKTLQPLANVLATRQPRKPTEEQALTRTGALCAPSPGKPPCRNFTMIALTRTADLHGA